MVLCSETELTEKEDEIDEYYGSGISRRMAGGVTS
jgi:hypothetical protein